jgi:hypothetical protein
MLMTKRLHTFLAALLLSTISVLAQAPQVGLTGDLDVDTLPKVMDGFEINFMVKEPHIINPAALCFDRKGRLFVGAGPQYRGPKADSPTDYIKIIIDNDDDGVADEVKTFAEGFNCIQAFAWNGRNVAKRNAVQTFRAIRIATFSAVDQHIMALSCPARTDLLSTGLQATVVRRQTPNSYYCDFRH